MKKLPAIECYKLENLSPELKIECDLEDNKHGDEVVPGHLATARYACNLEGSTGSDTLYDLCSDCNEETAFRMYELELEGGGYNV